MTILGIACFPVNPLVLTGVVETGFDPALSIVGWVVWAFGMVLVMAPIIMFPRCGGVGKGKSFVNATRLVDTGIYGVVRHPQYLGNSVLAVGASMASGQLWGLAAWALLFWIFYVPAIRREDEKLQRRFGNEWQEWRKRTPAVVPTHWPATNPGSHLPQWSLQRCIRNGELIWLTLIVVGLAYLYTLSTSF